MADQTLNLPSLFVVLLILVISIRYFFFTAPNSTSLRAASDRNTANPEHIEQIAQMFPQLSRRDIQWDLQRNGGSVQATTERVLSGRGLERLHHRLSQPEVTQPQEEEGKPKPPAWSQNKAERQALLQKRREDMVLAARRKFEEKERRERVEK
ncbi:MAG: hypothetical protein Q9208_004800 [Pyrenodesmia sp. 3 TL-2023]